MSKYVPSEVKVPRNEKHKSFTHKKKKKRYFLLLSRVKLKKILRNKKQKYS